MFVLTHHGGIEDSVAGSVSQNVPCEAEQSWTLSSLRVLRPNRGLGRSRPNGSCYTLPSSVPARFRYQN